MAFTSRNGTNTSRNEDDRNYAYTANMELAKLGSRQTCDNMLAVYKADPVVQPQTRKSHKESSVRTLHCKVDVDAPSALDSYRSRSKLWPKTLFVWATSPGHCRNVLKLLENGDLVFRRRILTALTSLRSDRVTELTTHALGFHFVAKLLEVGSEDQSLTVLKIVSKKPFQLINIACTSNGKGLVQKMIEMFKSLSPHMRVMFTSLEQDTLRLTIDRQGQSVVYCCLRSLSPKKCTFIFDTLVFHLMEIIRENKSCDGFGGVIMVQRCLKKAPEEYQLLLVEKIADYGLPLSKDPVGHYLLLDLLNSSKWLDVSRKLVRRLKGKLVHLAMHNISSKVVQECLIKSSSTDIGMSMECMVRELMESPLLSQMHQNIHAQSVIQSACSLTEGQLLDDLNAAIGNADGHFTI